MPVKKHRRDPRAMLADKIMSTMDRALASPHREACNANLATTTSAIIVSLHDNCEQFQGWSREACRAIVLAYALNAPMNELREMAKIAAQQTRFIEAWDDHVCREMGGCAFFPEENP